MTKKVNDFLYEKESYLIRGAFFEVWKAFKGLFKEKVVEKALRKELKERNLKADTQKRIKIFYKDEFVGIYTPDFVINDKIIIELKTKPFITQEDKKQFWYYLRGSSYRLGFLVNFGPEKLEIIRRVYDKARGKYKPIEQGSASDQRTHQRKSASIVV